jgi:transposase
MPRKVKVSSEVLLSAIDAAKTAKTVDELRKAQAVIFPCLLGLSDSATAKLLGRSRITVFRLRGQFKKSHAGKEPTSRSRGGRRYGYMSIDEERQFLSRFSKKASDGGVLVVGEIKKAFEATVGQKVAKTTIYRMLDRHGWRKIMPRPRHPKSNAKAQKGFKKTPQTGDPVR